jgi:hypothetical protein
MTRSGKVFQHPPLVGVPQQQVRPAEADPDRRDDDEMLADVELHDTQTMYVLLDENGRKGLKHLAATVLKVDDTIEVEVKSGPNKGRRSASRRRSTSSPPSAGS